MILTSERFVTDPAESLKKVEEFLNLKTFFNHRMFYFDKVKGFYCYVMNGEGQCMSRSKGLPHVKVDSKVKRQMSKYYREKNKDFNKLMNTTFQWSN